MLSRAVFDAENMTLPLHPRENGRILGPHTPKAVYDSLTTEAVTSNYHSDGYTPDAFTSNKVLDSAFRVLATNWDRKGKPFVSLYEGRELPFYATQFHPETNQFSFAPDDCVAHSANAVRNAQYFGNFFINEARKNTHRFPDFAMEKAALIHNYRPINQSVYFFFPDGREKYSCSKEAGCF